jgi:hypothetical protein
MFAVTIEVFHEVLGFHQLVSLEVDGADDLSILDTLDLLLDVGGVVKNALLHLLEFVDLHLALLDVLVDRETEPVVVPSSLVHLDIKLVEVRD